MNMNYFFQHSDIFHSIFPFCQISSSFWHKLEEMCFFHHFPPGVPEEIVFLWKKPNPDAE